MAMGDLIQQEIEVQSNVLPSRYDWARTGIIYRLKNNIFVISSSIFISHLLFFISARMFIVGTLLGPAHHYYYIYLDKILPQVNLKTVAKKILCDQLFASPATIICFFYGMGILEKKTMKQSTIELKDKFKYVYMVCNMFTLQLWPLVSKYCFDLNVYLIQYCC